MPREESGGSLLTGQAGVRHGWWRERDLGSCAERGNLSPRGQTQPVVPERACGCGWQREPQVAGTARGRVVMRGTGADLTVVAVKVL